MRINRYTYFMLLLVTLPLIGLLYQRQVWLSLAAHIDLVAGCSVRELLALPLRGHPFAVVAAAISIPRLRDCGLTGRWALLLFILLLAGVGWLAVLTLLVYPGNKATNRFGPQPPSLRLALGVTAWFAGVPLMLIWILTSGPPMGHSASPYRYLAGDLWLRTSPYRSIAELEWKTKKQFPPTYQSLSGKADSPDMAAWYGYGVTQQHQADGALVFTVRGPGISCAAHGTVTWQPRLENDTVVWSCTSTITEYPMCS